MMMMDVLAAAAAAADYNRDYKENIIYLFICDGHVYR